MTDRLVAQKGHATAPQPLLPLSRFDTGVVLIAVILAIAALILNRFSIIAEIGLFITICFATWLSVIDFREHRLPNPIVGALSAVVIAGLAFAAFYETDFGRFGRSILVGLGLSALLMAISFTGGLGAGDAKFIFPLAAVASWVSISTLITMLLVMALSGGIVSIGALLAGKGASYRLSYGPYIALGYVMALVLRGADIV